jgi:indolepyruvate ferredoxin oxidoreductase beta subunit
MNYDIITAGVGGQGILSISAIIASSALKSGLFVKQAEAHGMAQRGGAVVSHLRLSNHPLHSDLVAQGRADMIISMEPVESLRYLSYLSPGGTVLTAVEPVVNIPDYPDIEDVLAALRSLPSTRLIEAARLARQAGSARASNMVMVGAASNLLPVPWRTIEKDIRETFGRKSEKMVEINLRAFRLGRDRSAAVKKAAPAQPSERT